MYTPRRKCTAEYALRMMDRFRAATVVSLFLFSIYVAAVAARNGVDTTTCWIGFASFQVVTFCVFTWMNRVTYFLWMVYNELLRRPK